MKRVRARNWSLKIAISYSLFVPHRQKSAPKFAKTESKNIACDLISLRKKLS